jgi:hypothetical protein
VKKKLAVLVGIHPDRTQTSGDFLGDFLGRVGFDDAAIAAQQIED